MTLERVLGVKNSSAVITTACLVTHRRNRQKGPRLMEQPTVLPLVAALQLEYNNKSWKDINVYCCPVFLSIRSKTVQNLLITYDPWVATKPRGRAP